MILRTLHLLDTPLSHYTTTHTAPQLPLPPSLQGVPPTQAAADISACLCATDSPISGCSSLRFTQHASHRVLHDLERDYSNTHAAPHSPHSSLRSSTLTWQHQQQQVRRPRQLHPLPQQLPSTPPPYVADPARWHPAHLHAAHRAAAGGAAGACHPPH